MRCPECGLSNEADSLFCLGCAAELVRGAAAETEPPRARSRLRRRLRAFGAAVNRAGGNLVYLREQARSGSARTFRVLLRFLFVLTCSVPGLPHLLTGHAWAGLWLLAAFTAAALLWVLFMGSVIGTVMILAALSLMLSSALDGLRLEPASGRRGPLLLHHVLLALAILAGSYAVGTGLLAIAFERATIMTNIVRLAPPRSGLGPTTVFESGDHLLFSRRAYRRADPARGDVVLAHVGGMLNVVRVLAVPGDWLEYHAGTVYLNGEPMDPAAYPLEPVNPFEVHGGHVIRPEWSEQVREGEYVAWGIHGGEAGVGMGPAIIRRAEIVGKAWVVYCPCWRHRFVNHLHPEA